MKTVSPTRYDGVWLAGGRLPISADPPLARLVKGVERVASIRAEIAHAAKVATMPPVEVVPYIWTRERVLICGRVTALRQGDGALLWCSDSCADRSLYRSTRQCEPSWSTNSLTGSISRRAS